MSKPTTLHHAAIIPLVAKVWGNFLSSGPWWLFYRRDLIWWVEDGRVVCYCRILLWGGERERELLRVRRAAATLGKVW